MTPERPGPEPERPEPGEGAESGQETERHLPPTQESLDNIVTLARQATSGGERMVDGATTKDFPAAGVEVTAYPEGTPEGEPLAIVSDTERREGSLDEGFHIWQESGELKAEKLVPAGEPSPGLSLEGRIQEAMEATRFEKDIGLSFFSLADAKEAIEQLRTLSEEDS